MYDLATRKQALRLITQGFSMNAVSKLLDISRAAIRDWRDRPQLAPTRSDDCPRCAAPPVRPDASAYAHLLGLYLGDGCVSALRKGVYSLRITCDDRYPALQAEVAASIRAVRPGGKVFFVPSVGCTNVTGLWKHWPCVFPQHGPGPKHLRRIELEEWQRDIVRHFPGRFLRGLFHSDGCRVTNWTVRTIASGPKRYEYPRYFFTNTSTDIIGLCTWALDLLGIEWKMSNTRNVSVARRGAVAALDLHVGPKH